MVNLYLGGAPYYDLDTVTYGSEDIRFYRRQADELSRPPEKTRILELACGTGRVSIPLARAGYSVVGLDLSEAMLRIFQDKLARQPGGVGSRVSVYHGDMADFDLPGPPFDLIIIPFRGFQALVETGDAMSCLNRIKRHLAPTGVFILDIFAVAPFNRWLDDFQERLDWKRTDPATGRLITRARIAGRCDIRRQVIHPTTIYYVSHPDGRSERIEDHFCLRYYFQHQMETLLVASGFEILAEYGDYSGAPIGEGAEQLFVCRHLPRPKLLG
ncbi:MAG: class I SAM-dependent methyltransferase [Alkalispirochaetaceae bacterium]